MGQTVVGFFKDVSDVQKAVQRLESKGISNQQVDISTGKHLDGTADPDGRNTNKITDFFNKLFGHESDDARLYSTIGQQHVHILTVHAISNEMAETAADILDECGALDVDEQNQRSSDTNGTRRSDSSTNAGGQYSGSREQSNLQRDSSRSSRSDVPGEDKSLSYRDDYANTLSTETPGRDINEPTNVNDDLIGDRGPGMQGPNSNYVDERSFPGDHSGSANDKISNHDTNTNMRNPVEESGKRSSSMGNLGAGSNDDYLKSGEQQADYNNESGTRSRGADFTGQDMTNDRISSPDDDQRTINQNNPQHDRRNMISDEQSGGLETPIPTPEEQRLMAKRRSRIINASVSDNNRLRDF